MTPHFADDHLTVYVGDVRDVLPTLPAESVHCVVTSPPYWGLRDYGVAGQLGLVPAPEEYVANLVAIFREVRRVLRADGTVWLNLGDSYTTGGSAGRSAGFNARYFGKDYALGSQGQEPSRPQLRGMKPKDLVGIPWRVAFALQADGWYLRSDIIWSKPNPMPESVTDRPTKAHEYLFLLTKSARYFYDAEAIRLPVSPNWERGAGPPVPEHGYHVLTEGRTGHQVQRIYDEPKGANARTVWTIATQPYAGSHFATFPEALVEPCVKAGTSERGVCPECGAPWAREMQVTGRVQAHWEGTEQVKAKAAKGPHGVTSVIETGSYAVRKTIGWRPSCAHDAEPVTATVLDPFAGSGTTGRVTNRLGRRAILIDLSADYIDQAMLRNAQAPLGLGA